MPKARSLCRSRDGGSFFDADHPPERGQYSTPIHIFDASKPDGMPRKLLDVSRLGALGCQPVIDLESGLRETYAWFLANLEGLRS